ncbi:M3 family metallopeptidase [Psychroflexus lacisalsi]|uniref:oligopeptidase A n=1 Tax=Psychroflexus lacisalsi TaxID=503928 RepID=A0ABP3VI64_9FLAO|nr:M3 family metallopeptidase [Psychroflexus lacisalsi]MBZ9619635.1 M3 family metallopeptidase [Psychroflexus lacisalsi]
MKIHSKLIILSLLTLSIAYKEKAKDSLMTENSLLKEWDGPYEGVPNFESMQLEDLEPAMDQAIGNHLSEIEDIANSSEPATFENTIEALERAGKLVDRVYTYYGIWSSNLSSEEFRDIQQKLSPKLSDYQSKILQNEELFKRIKTVHDNSLEDNLERQEQRVVELVYKSFEMNGANLDAAGKGRYAEINKELSKLYTDFSNNILHDEENYVTFLDENQLGGLSDSFIRSAKKEAERQGQPEQYAIVNTRSSMDPFLTYSDERELREKVWRNYYSRGDNDDEYDNNELIKKILKLRDERVALLGYDNYAQWRLQDRMAKNPENAMNLLMAVWPSAIARVEEEVEDMQEVANKENAGIEIEAWDYRYYAEKVRQEKYDLDSEEVKEYLVLDNLTDAIFYVAGRLFDFEFSEITDGSVPVFHQDVKVYEVTSKSNGEHIGLFYLDPYARKGKRSGAWATTYRSYTSYDGETNVLASNNSNFVKAAEGEPVLVSWDDAETFFHEFGHALHFLSADVKYPTLNGGVRDYTEFQSQLLERWIYTDEVINNYLKHYETGQPMPEELIAKIKKASKFNQGFATTEFLASAIMDMKYHTTNPSEIDPKTFEKETLDELKMPEELVMRHRSPHFGHVFSGEGYATGYYGYLWADVLTSDAAEAFAEVDGGFYDEDLSEKLVKFLFAPRNAIDPAKAYRQFRGRDAEIDALMRDRGFPVPE